MRKSRLEMGGPLLFAGAWIALAGGAFLKMAQTATNPGWVTAAGALALSGGGALLVQLAWRSFRQESAVGAAKVNIWSSGRPGEVLVGVLHTGSQTADPEGLILNLDCVEKFSGGQWLLWTTEIRSPTPTAPDHWPFHFSLPVEGPPSGPSTEGEVVWQLRAKSCSLPLFEATIVVPVARVAGPPSHLLPVPPPAFRKGGGRPRRAVEVTELPDQKILRSDPRAGFPGPSPIVVWAIGLVGVLMVLVRMKAPLWAPVAVGVLNGAAAIACSLLWFMREEVVVTEKEILIRRTLWKMGKALRTPRETVTGVRVSFSGPSGQFGVRMERGDASPLAAFDGFSDSLDAHEAARTVLRALGQTK